MFSTTFTNKKIEVVPPGMPRRAFTLIELLVVIAIIGMLSTVAAVGLSSARINARNTQRKADLVQISKALELYYTDNGAYPSTGGVWWGEVSGYGSHALTGASGYVPNLSPTYMGVLPHDPNTGKVNPSSPSSGCQTTATSVGYLYRSDGIDYKILAHCLPEGGAVPAADPFYDYAGSDYSVYTPGAKAW